MEILILKVGALGDVLRTTSVLPGLRGRYPGARITWVTAGEARDLLRLNPAVERVCSVDPESEASVEALASELADVSWTRVLSLDDEPSGCALANRLVPDRKPGVLSGAYLAGSGERTYTEDVSPWFDMGLISKLGRPAADELKKLNVESHPAIFARMLGIESSEPQLFLPPELEQAAKARLAPLRRPVIGLNTGAGERWASKRLDVARTVELVHELERRLDRPSFLLLGGEREAQRNAEILASCRSAQLVDANEPRDLLRFAALVSNLNLLITSDSLGLHVAVAKRVPTVAFFAPTSATEIELYGRGEKVVSTAPDACSYRSDADTSTLTVERLADAAVHTLGRHGSG